MKMLLIVLLSIVTILTSAGMIYAANGAEKATTSVADNIKKTFLEQRNSFTWIGIGESADGKEDYCGGMCFDYIVSKKAYRSCLAASGHSLNGWAEIGLFYTEADKLFASQIVEKIDKYCEENNITDDYYRANIAIQFVQANIEYESDIDYVKRMFNEDCVGDYVKSPIQTFYEGCGDCEDMALAEYALLEAMGYDPLFCIVRGSGRCHAILLMSGEQFESSIDPDVEASGNAAGVFYNYVKHPYGGTYYWVESTAHQSVIGTAYDVNMYNEYYYYKF